MQSSPGCPAPLLPKLSAELARLEAQLGQTANRWALARLAELGDAAAARVLRAVAETGTRVRSLSAFINHHAKQEAMQRNAAGIPTAESAACCNGPFARASQGVFRNHSPSLYEPYRFFPSNFLCIFPSNCYNALVLCGHLWKLHFFFCAFPLVSNACFGAFVSVFFF